MSADNFGPINMQSGKVTKQAHEDQGKTAHRETWFNAPSDRYFVEESWAIQMISAKGKNAFVRIKDFKRKEVIITLPSGVVVTHKFVVSILVVAHAETGSGYTLDAVTAWAEGEFSALTQEFE